MKQIFFAIIFIAVFSLTALPVEAAPCEAFNSSDDLQGQWPGFGMPFNVFSATKLSSGILLGTEKIMTANCPNSGGGGSGVSFRFGASGVTHAIFEDAYILNSVDNTWQKTNISQTTAAGNSGNTTVQNLLDNTSWIAFEASGSFNGSSIPNNADVYLAAYICVFENGGWECGCTDENCTSNNWQIQKVPFQGFN